MSEYHLHTLPNGLRIIHTSSPTSVAYCGFAINAGTRDELPQEQGMAHFVEHLLFKGTRRRKAWHILNRMENVGGDLNAYTNKEETVVYAAFMKEDFVRAAELLADIVFNSVFPDTEVSKEVEVIVDEILSYADSPAELIFDDFEEMIYPNHPLGHNILGKPELLRFFRAEDARRWVDTFYRPSNMVFFVWADIDFSRIVRRMEMLTSGIGNVMSSSRVRLTPDRYVPQRITLQKNTHQAHVMMGTRAYRSDDERRTGLYLLNNLLGGPGMNSRLNLQLREKSGLVYNVESNITTYTDTGIFSIYFGADKEDVEHCMTLVKRELQRLCEQPLTDIQLRAARKQLKGQIGVASDNFESMALDMGKCFLHYGKVDSRDQILSRIDALTTSRLQDIAQDIFDEGKLSLLCYE